MPKSSWGSSTPSRHPTKLKPCTVPVAVPGCASTPGGQTAPHRATRCTGRSRSRKYSPLEIACMVSMPWWPTRRSSAVRKSPARPGRTTATMLIDMDRGRRGKGLGRPGGVLLPERHQDQPVIRLPGHQHHRAGRHQRSRPHPDHRHGMEDPSRRLLNHMARRSDAGDRQGVGDRPSLVRSARPRRPARCRHRRDALPAVAVGMAQTAAC